ncbi:MAG: thioredoxin-disulfide reductase [Desulfovibrio sp.]|uniref:thioredoxin-disulfide reductase n=1 Tax=Desulfovibrio sp. 7SRBS1 TaxID=3378064 RepID=UPI003B3FC6FB
MKTYDAIVIGGGPAGMTAALYLLRSEVSLAFVEKLSSGGQMLQTEKIENYPGFPDGILGYELADLLEKQVQNWKTEDFFHYRDEVRTIEPSLDGSGYHKVQVGDEWIAARTVIVCSGSAYRKLGVAGELRLLGKGVSYCALCDGNFFRDQVVAVVGGGNSALEEALYLARLVKKLYLIHRRDEFRGTKCYQDKCFAHPKIEVLRSTVVNEILGEHAVSGISVKNLKTGEDTTVDLDGVFMFVGFQPQGGFLPDQLDKDAQGFVVTDAEMRTNIKGLYAAGDIRSKMCRQVATAVGDGATAANSALTYLENYE